MTDVSNASRTNFMNLTTLTWDEHILKMFGVTSDMLASIRSNAEVYGHISEGPLKGVAISGRDIFKTQLPACIQD